MDLRTCEYCGTEFGVEESECPLCGFVPGEMPVEKHHYHEEPTEHRKAAKPSGNSDRIPRWMLVAVCCVLGLALLIGYVLFKKGKL